MAEVKSTYLLWIAVIILIAAFQLWNLPYFSEANGFPFNLYFKGTAIAFFLFCLFIFINFRTKLIAFLCFAFSLNNLTDELFFDPTKMQLNELLFTIGIISFGIYRQRLIERDTNRAGEAATDDRSRFNSRNT